MCWFILSYYSIIIIIVVIINNYMYMQNLNMPAFHYIAFHYKSMKVLWSLHHTKTILISPNLKFASHCPWLFVGMGWRKETGMLSSVEKS